MLEAGLEHAQKGSIAPRRRVQGVHKQWLVLQRPVEVLQRVHVALALEQRRRVEDEHVEEVEGSVAMRADVEGLHIGEVDAAWRGRAEAMAEAQGLWRGRRRSGGEGVGEGGGGGAEAGGGGGEIGWR